MKYEYKCDNKDCVVKTIIINKPMCESSRKEYCKICNKELSRVYNTFHKVTET